MGRLTLAKYVVRKAAWPRFRRSLELSSRQIAGQAVPAFLGGSASQTSLLARRFARFCNSGY